MKAHNSHITKVAITEKNSGVVSFIKKEIAAKKARHEAIIQAVKNHAKAGSAKLQ